MGYKKKLMLMVDAIPLFPMRRGLNAHLARLYPRIKTNTSVMDVTDIPLTTTEQTLESYQFKLGNLLV